jgi:hypothetical protein
VIQATTPCSSAVIESTRAPDMLPRRVLAMPNSPAKLLTPMKRFLAEGPAEQSALFVRSDTDQLSTTKGCTWEPPLDKELDSAAVTDTAAWVVWIILKTWRA